MIPKIIHYCWFGGKPLPRSAVKCINSWRKFFPDYEIIEWNEDNFDVHEIAYTSEAYELGKYAYVSDYARFKVLYENGGIYFDTDVEVIKSFDNIVSRGPFMGFEIGECLDKRYPNLNWMDVAPGLGMGAEPYMSFLNEILDYYSKRHYSEDGKTDMVTVCIHTTKNLCKYGLIKSSDIQFVGGFYIYPPDYFNPLDDVTGKLRITNNTVSIHWFTKSWAGHTPLRIWGGRMVRRLFGSRFTQKIKKVL